MEGNLKSVLWNRPLLRRTFVRGAALVAAATGVTTLAGCTTPETTPTVAPTAGTLGTAAPAATRAPGAGAPPTAAASPKYGGTFHVVSSGDAANQDPHLIVSLQLHVTGPAVAYSKLLHYRTDAKPGEFIPIGDLAASWEQADDVTYVFKLRPNAKWQNIAPLNGRAVVAEDIKFSFERQLALKTNASGLSGLARADVVDSQTIKLTLGKPDADFLVTLADTRNKIVSKEAVAVRGDLMEGPTIGSGPWILERYERNSIADFTRNRDYYQQGLPYADRLESPRITDPATAQSALRAGQLDFLSSLTVQDAKTISESNPNLGLSTTKVQRGIYIGMNTSKPPFNDQRVRQAIFKGINKQAILQSVFSGQAWYYPSLRVPSPDWALPESEMRTAYAQDVAGAKQMLAAAGVAPGTAIQITVLNLADWYVDTAQLVKSDLDALGLTTTLRPLDSANFVSNVYDKATYDLAVSPTTPVSSTNADLNAVHRSGATRSASHVSDPKLDQMIEQQATLVRDPEARKRALLELQRYLLSSAHQLHLAGIIDQTAMWKYVKNFFYGQVDSSTVDETWASVWLDK
jgi:peptide/nickel transport system substrate-binding protein